MQLTIKYLLGVILGEEDLQFVLHADIPKISSNFIKTGYGAGYRVNINELSIMISRVNKIAAIFSGPPLYYFEGVIKQDTKETMVAGRITMIWYPKYFILAWTALVLLAMIACTIMAMFLSIKFMVFPSQIIENYLLTAGFMFGAVASLSVFGVIVISSIKLISQNQKESLKQFCKSLNEKAHTL
ncbi:MAG: hypothetical protein Q8Q45_04050 [Methylococcaceae bacterium]|uniref:hypothetical protein n=1 Tax=Methylicorpusculum sp. TaxID=2713644 RepID=UPI00277475EA|nr:hypothetical protein [Methylicorpusculum sp.]MDP2392137.1 hypothetical protein [Methylococcaceae bacterium]MDP3389434.1 hypothetical protein [Methylococcaceae bacterium]MDP3931503.1 hypothetical protein [Methylococcaceae bacterium]MDZ4151297.1 hypothetical protein [Methylicorpusculum sp.]